MISDNSSTANATDAHALDGATVAAALLQLVICIVGLFLYALTCWMMLKYRKSTFSNPFYTLAMALAAPDCLHLAMQLICAIPSVFIGVDSFSSAYMAACGFLTNVAYWCLAPMMVVIGVNRYIAVCHFQSYKVMFTPARIRVMVACCWALGFFLPSLMYGCTCFYVFKEIDWTFDCSGGCQHLAMRVNMAVASSLTISVVLIYTLTFVQYKLIQRRIGLHNRQQGTTNHQHEADRQSKREAALMFQFALISSVLVIYVAAFWLVTLFWHSRYGGMFLNLFVSLNSCVSPVLYLSFGSEFRRRLPWRQGVSQGHSAAVAHQGASAPGSGGVKVMDMNRVMPIAD